MKLIDKIIENKGILESVFGKSYNSVFQKREQRNIVEQLRVFGFDDIGELERDIEYDKNEIAKQLGILNEIYNVRTDSVNGNDTNVD